MPSDFPPQPSRRSKIILAVVGLATLLYSILVTAQILLWFVLVGVAVGLYLIWLLIVAVFRLVEAVERLATAAEVDSGIRSPSDARPGRSAETPDGPPGDTRIPPNDEATDDRADRAGSVPASDGVDAENDPGLDDADADAADAADADAADTDTDADPDDRADGA